MRRITVEEIKEAYKKTGIKPMRKAFAERRCEEKCGCALTALACSVTSFEFIESLVSADNELDLVYRPVVERVAARLGLNKDYAVGFIGGFDSLPRGWYLQYPTELVGYDDGNLVALAIFAEVSP